MKGFVNIIKYTIYLCLGAGLLYYVYRGDNFSQIQKYVYQLNIFWVSLSIVFGLVGHYLRALRWSLALKPLNHHLKPFHGFLCIMAGYCINTFLPRVGEFVRCWFADKKYKIPTEAGLGTLVSERVFDLIVLLVLTAFTVLFQFDTLATFLFGHVKNIPALSVEGMGLIYLGMGFVLFILFIYVLRKQIIEHTWYAKIKKVISLFLNALLSIRKLNRKEQYIYLAYTFMIWIFYYFMVYAILANFYSVEELSVGLGFAVLAMGSIGMAIPTPGGIGSYHLFTSFALLSYGISEEVAKSFAFISHSIQSLSLVFLGGIAILLIFFKK